MRLVVDTNVFVSLLIHPTNAFEALVDYFDTSATVLYSTETLTELVDVLRRRKFSKYTTATQVTAFVEWFASTGELVIVEHPVAGSRDPNDDKFLSLAVAGGADYLIGGDQDLLTLGRIQTIPIVSPAAFLAAIDS